MARWTDLAAWRGPTPNQGGPMVEQRGGVVHIAEGTFEGTIAWLNNPSSQTSAHFVVARDGRVAQLVDTDVTAWTQRAGNGRWISVENEGHTPQALTDAQVRANAAILARAHQVYGVPIQLAGSPAGRGLGYHSMGGAAWGHLACPGPAIIAQLPAIVTAAGAITGGDDGMAEMVGSEPLGGYLSRIERALWWKIPQIASRLEEVAAAEQARDAAEATAIAGLRAAVDALAKAVQVGGGSIDAAAILARVDQRAAEVRTLVEQQHAAETAGLRAQLDALTQGS